MPRWPISDERARAMYTAGRGNADARWFARFWGRLFGAGLLPLRWVTLEVRSRNSGRVTTFPLGMADLDGRWYLVSMLGECNWASNVRAADGQAVLRRRRRRPVLLDGVIPAVLCVVRVQRLLSAAEPAVLPSTITTSLTLPR